MENPFPAEPHHAAPAEPNAATEHQSSHDHASGAQEGAPATDAVSGQAEAPAQAHSHEQAHAEEPEHPHTVPHTSEEHEHSDETPQHESQSVNQSEHHSEHSSGAPSHESENAACESSSLEDFAERARRGRLNSDEESEAAVALKEALLGGRSDVAKAVAATPSLPWIVSVQATANAWPDMKPSFRSQFLAGLARAQGEQAARIRLSLARGLFKVDQGAALKLILLTLKLLRNKETGLLEGKGPALFANVLIGRGKAWALQLPLQNLKPIEADLLVFAALHGAFHAPQAPIAQLSILKWAAATERLTRLPEALEALILKGISRWSAKWQGALRKEVSPIPESWIDGLKQPASRHSGVSRKDEAESGARTDGEELPESEASSDADSSVDGGEHGARDRDEEEPKNDAERDLDDEEDIEDDEEEDEQDDEETRPKQKQRPVYVSKTVPNHAPGQHPQQSGRRGNTQSQSHFNLQDTLRQIDAYVANLRGELATAQKQLRQREDDPRRGRRNERPAVVTVPGELSTEELLRLNQQLESRNAELKARIDELTIDSEERAASCGLTTDSAPPDPSTQLRSLLGFKLKDDYEDYLALQQEARDLVVQQHYRTVLQHVFEVLLAEGISFPESAPESGS